MPCHQANTFAWEQMNFGFLWIRFLNMGHFLFRTLLQKINPRRPLSLSSPNGKRHFHIRTRKNSSTMRNALLETIYASVDATRRCSLGEVLKRTSLNRSPVIAT